MGLGLNQGDMVFLDTAPSFISLRDIPAFFLLIFPYLPTLYEIEIIWRKIDFMMLSEQP